jgi:hypothetical protein
MRLDLYHYVRSSSPYGVGIARNRKRRSDNSLPAHPNRGGGEQFKPSLRQLSDPTERAWVHGVSQTIDCAKFTH